MPLPKFKKQEDIPKGFEELYEEKDGEWQPKPSETDKLEQTLATVRTEKKAAEKAQKEAEDKAADLQRRLDAKEASTGETDKKITEMLAKWEGEKNSAVKAVQDKLDAKEAELRTLKLDDKLKAAFLAAGGRPEKADAALRLTKGNFDLVDGQIVMKDAAGQVSTVKMEDYYGKTYKQEMPEFYQATKAKGGGAGGGSSTQPENGEPAKIDTILANPLAALQSANAEAAAK